MASRATPEWMGQNENFKSYTCFERYLLHSLKNLIKPSENMAWLYQSTVLDMTSKTWCGPQNLCNLGNPAANIPIFLTASNRGLLVRKHIKSSEKNLRIKNQTRQPTFDVSIISFKC